MPRGNIHLFNPPNPDCQPIYSGQPFMPRVGPCGRCQGIPKHFRIKVQQVLTVVFPGIDELEANLAGEWILTRRIPSNEAIRGAFFPFCCFLSRPVDTTGFYTHPEGASPGDVLNNAPLNALSLWRLYFDSPGSLEWRLEAGAFWWFEGDLTPDSLGGEGAITGGNVGTYTAASWRQPAHFRCLYPNVFTADEGVFQSSFPPTITVEPFWP